MEFTDVVRDRRSIRVYEDRPVEEEKLNQILEAANLAPSAGNAQSYGIVVVTEKEIRAKLTEACGNQEFVLQAPVSLVFITDAAKFVEKFGGGPALFYATQDAAIACTQAMLAARDLGLGSVWIGAYESAAVSEVIGLTSEYVPVAVLPVGYPAESPDARPRRELNELAHREKW